MIFSTIISLVYNLTDTYFIGLLDDPAQLGAISLAFPVFLLFQVLGNMFGAGAPSYISRCLGAARYDEVRRTSVVSVYMSAGMMLVLTVVGLLFGADPWSDRNQQRYHGAGNYKRMTDALKFTMLTGTVLCLVFMIPFAVLAPAYIGILPAAGRT